MCEIGVLKGLWYVLSSRCDIYYTTADFRCIKHSYTEKLICLIVSKILLICLIVLFFVIFFTIIRVLTMFLLYMYLLSQNMSTKQVSISIAFAII